jgi:hypothetical protein
MNKKKVDDQISYPKPKRSRRSEPINNMDKSAVNGKSLNVSENSLDGIDIKEWKMRALEVIIKLDYFVYPHPIKKNLLPNLECCRFIKF